MNDRHDPPWDHFLAFQLHGARIGIGICAPVARDGTGARDSGHLDAAIALVRQALPAGARPAAADDVDQVCSIVVGTDAPRSSGAPPHRLLVESELVSEPDDRDTLLEELASALDFAVAEHATERVFLHAGVVEWQGRAIVIPGRSLSGKTTLVAALVRAGATYYSDEYAPIDTEGRVWPHPRPLSVRAPGSTGPGRPVPIEALGATPGTEPVPVGLVVHTHHQPGSTWRPVELDAGDGMLKVLDNAVVARTKPQLALSLLGRATAAARVLHGPRGDADETAALILRASSGPAPVPHEPVVAFEAPVGETFGSLRHLLVRMVLAVRHATAVHAASHGPTAPPIGIALAPIAPTPHAVAAGASPMGLPWSAVFDLAHLEVGAGVPIAALADVVRERPAMRWRHLALVPPAAGREPGTTWEPTSTDDAAGPGAATAPTAAPWISTRTVMASCAPDTRGLTEALLPAPDAPDAGVLVTGAAQVGWGATYGSIECSAILAALRPNAELSGLAHRLVPAAPHLGVHWQRGPFTFQHPEAAPSPRVAGEQIAAAARDRAVHHVLLVAHAPEDEVDELRAWLATTEPSLEVTWLSDAEAGDLGDLAWGAVHHEALTASTWFLGTRHAPDSVAVREARAASGRWAPDATWGVLCGDAHHPPDPDDPDHGPIWE